jgi:hypothetical protein
MTVANYMLGNPPTPFIRYIKTEANGQYRTLHRKPASNVDLVRRSTILTSTTAFCELGGDLSVKSHWEGGIKGKICCVFWDGAQYLTVIEGYISTFSNVATWKPSYLVRPQRSENL